MRRQVQPDGLRLYLKLVLLFAIVLEGGGRAAAGVVIDRIVAIVNHHVILDSQWDEAVRFECLLNGRALSAITPEERRKTLDRMIDQELISEQMEAAGFARATPEAVAHRVQEMRRDNATWATDQGWRTALATYGLSEQDVSERVGVQLDILRFVDVRFRPSIHIDRRSIEEYYNEQLLPELQRAGAAEVPLKQVSPKIEEVLIQQRMDEMLAVWVRSLRGQTEVQVR